MARAGPRKIARYGEQFKATAVKLSSLPGVLIQVRDGVIVTKSAKLDVHTAAELKRLRVLERQHKVLKEEHELLKKAIRFASDRKRKPSSSSKQTGPNTKSH